MNELGLNDIWEEEGKSQFVKRRIKETLIDQGKKEMLDKITGMKSLKFYLKIREENTSIYTTLDRDVRGAIAWARLGGFVWQGTKKGGVRECPMCGGNDSLMHILTVCENFKNEREVIIQN